MKSKTWILALIMASATLAHAATNSLTGLLQKGLFEEEANRNLDAAISEYQSLASAFDKDRQVAATAIFRLGECYRKLGRTNDAVIQYQRIVREFGDQQSLVTLSRQNLAGLSSSSSVEPETPPDPLLELRQRINAAAADFDKNQALLTTIKAMDPQQLRRALPELIPDAQLDSLETQLNQAQQDLIRMKNDYTPDHPKYKNAQEVIDEIDTKIRERISGILVGVQAKADSTAAYLDRLNAEYSERLKAESKKTPVSNPVTVSSSGENTLVTDDEEKQIRNIQAMIQNSPDLINAPDTDGYTPLQLAAAKGQLVVAKYLLDHGAKVNGRNRHRTALYAATENGHKAMVELLLARGADVNADNPLYRAVSKGFSEVAEVLLANKADVNLGGNNNEPPLAAAAWTGNTELVQSLIRHGADVNAQDMNGETPLDFTADANQTNAAKILIAAKANIESRTKVGDTPLHKAASAGNAGMVSLLLDAGASVDATNNNGATPLLLAVAGRGVDATRVLLEHKADPNHTGQLPNGGGNYTSPIPPVYPAIWHHNNDILELLLNAGANPEGNSAPPSESPLASAINGNNTEAVQLLLQHGANPNRPVPDGNPPLVEVVQARMNKRMFTSLLDKGADPNAKDRNGYAPLYVTTDPEIGRQLIEHKADVNARGPNGYTPLIYHWSSPEFVRFLLTNGANPDLQATNGDTALHEAVNVGQTNTVGILLENKANPNIQNNAGDTPLDLAKEFLAPFNPGRLPFPNTRAPVSHENAEAMIAMLTKAGGLANLPKRDRIEVRRGSYRSSVFLKGEHDWNRFSLLETIATAYGLLDSKTAGEWQATIDTRQNSFNPALRFPDFKRVIVYRRTGNSVKQTAMNADVENLLNTGDCSRDLRLQWGDVVEIPEIDHPVGEQWPGLSDSDVAPMSKCLAREVTVTLKGENTTLKLAPQFAPQPGYPTGPMRVLVHTSFMLRSVLDNSKLIRVSSDLSRVKVTRADPETKKRMEWTVDCTNPNQADLWLRDGDVIEVPEK